MRWSAAAVSWIRELMWILASFAVRPGLQGQGIGAQLLAAALHHGRGCLRGHARRPADPARSAATGWPASTCTRRWCSGVGAREAIPVVERVRDGSAGDFDLMDSVDRRTRGAAHGSRPRRARPSSTCW